MTLLRCLIWLALVVTGINMGAALAASPNDGADQQCSKDAMLVFDASGSMASAGYNELEVPRMHQALTAVRKVLPAVTPYRRIGLLVYGPGPKDACSNIDLRLTPMPNAAARILSELDRVVPDGNTPLTEAVRSAADVLKFKERPGVVVLVTDGDETCGGRPCQIANHLASAGLDLTIHVIGFKVRDRFFSWQSQAAPQSSVRTAARCLADQNKGEYISAESTEELIAALQVTLGCPLLTENVPRSDKDFAFHLPGKRK